MREIRLYGSEGGGAGRSPYPYQRGRRHCESFDQLITRHSPLITCHWFYDS